jgi:hypothetical protein
VENQNEKRLKALLESHGRLVAVVVGCVAALVLVALVEMGFRVVEWRAAARECRLEYSTKGFIRRDPSLGSRPKADTTVTAESACPDGRVLFRTTYTIDSLARRVTPVASSDQREEFILFFGGSFIFGSGVNDQETLPYYVGRLARCYRPHNYGFMGYGPQQMLAKLQSGSIPKEVSQRDGLLIYGYMGEADIGHIDRAIGSLYVYGWARLFPYYHVETATGKLVRDGNFTSGRPLQSVLYRLLLKSAIVRVLGVNHPVSIEEKHVRLTARIIEESYISYKKQFPTDAFYVVIFPGAVQSTSDQLITMLTESGIRCLDYRGLAEFSGTEYRIPVDLHPSAKWNKRLAERIVNDLGLQGEECHPK